MVKLARIVVTDGPDEGLVFELTDELSHVGRSSDGQVVLTDPLLKEHQASILLRNGRYAISTPFDDLLTVDGSALPADQWVWLRGQSRIQMSAETVVLFRYESADDDGASSDDGGSEKSAEGAGAGTSGKKKKKRTSDQKTSGKKNSGQNGAGQKASSLKKISGAKTSGAKTSGAKAKRGGSSSGKHQKVAEFLTAQDGDRLVRLGEDGQLPELYLSDSDDRERAVKKPSGKNSLVLYVVLGMSLLMTVGMIFIPEEPGGDSQRERVRDARRKIRDFHGDESAELKPYQRSLRKAQRAYSARNRRAERRAYLQVLNFLNAEDIRRSHHGLTGDKNEDELLRGYIALLIPR